MVDLTTDVIDLVLWHLLLLSSLELLDPPSPCAMGQYQVNDVLGSTRGGRPELAICRLRVHWNPKLSQIDCELYFFQ